MWNVRLFALGPLERLDPAGLEHLLRGVVGQDAVEIEGDAQLDVIRVVVDHAVEHEASGVSGHDRFLHVMLVC